MEEILVEKRTGEQEIIKLANEFWTESRIMEYEEHIDSIIDTVYLLDEQYYEETRHHLIRHVEKRLKTADSIAHKLIRKEKRIQEKPLEELLNDLAGVRLICYDIEQIYWVVLKIHQMGKFEVIKEKDYVLKPKENGYQSFHMIIQMDGQRVELQIRTILMDAWSSLDAILTYKKENMVSDKLKKDIRRMGKWSSRIDEMVTRMLEQYEQ